MKTMQGLSGKLLIAIMACLVIGTSVHAQSGTDFWAMQVGNSWTYNGVGYTRQDAISNTDSSTIPGYLTFVTTSSDGTDQYSSWYSATSREMREWQEVGWDATVGQVTMRLQSGVLWAINPIIVGDHWITTSNGTASGGGQSFPFTLSLDVVVLSHESVTLPFGVYQAYVFRHTINISADAASESMTQFTWFVPYLGIVKRQDEMGYTEDLSSTNVTASRMFLDVPSTHLARTFIEQLATAGITGGCAAGPPPQYCPEDSITRGQMAVFLVTSLGKTPGGCIGRFNDVPIGHPFCGFIERLADDGVTGGCSAANFCPNDPVSRGQMAVFIEAALGNPPNTSCARQFTDVTSANPFCRFIERLADDGITGGCGSGNFCPNNPVTRGEMAVFLVAAPSPLDP
jgi:hypothetical protein